MLHICTKTSLKYITKRIYSTMVERERESERAGQRQSFHTEWCHCNQILRLESQAATEHWKFMNCWEFLSLFIAYFLYVFLRFSTFFDQTSPPVNQQPTNHPWNHLWETVYFRRERLWMIFGRKYCYMLEILYDDLLVYVIYVNIIILVFQILFSLFWEWFS